MSAEATIGSYSDHVYPWDEGDYLEPEPIECKETDVQQKMDFTERSKTFIDGIDYWVTEGNSPLIVIDGPVSYKFSYALSPKPIFLKAPLDPVPDVTKVQEDTFPKRRKHLRLSPHAKFTKEILRRPNAKGR